MGKFIPSPAHPNTPPELSSFVDTATINNATYMDYYKRLRLLALSMFKWENLPESMNERFLEQTLYLYGLACFVYDENMGFLNLKAMPSSQLNVYEEATQYTAWSLNYNKVYNREDLTLVYNNYDKIPTYGTISLFAQRLYEAERTINVNIRAQKTPVLVMCPEQQRLTLKNAYMQFDGNEPVIFGDKNFTPDSFQVLKTDAPYVADKVQEYKRNVWSEALSFLGVKNIDTEKRERLVTEEATANQQMIELSAETMLLCRQQAADEFNRKWGTNVSVSLRTGEDVSRETTSPDDEPEEGEESE